MQYFGKAIGTVSRTWNSLNPSTLSGAIDVVVVKQSNEELHCSAFHIRFGKLSLWRPSDKIVDFYVNGEKIDLHMKVGEGGEAFFVFGTDADVPESLLTSPVVSPAGSPKPGGDQEIPGSDQDVDYLDISDQQTLSPKSPSSTSSQSSVDDASPFEEEDNLEPKLRDQKPSRIDEIIKRLQNVKIPSAHENSGSVIMDTTGYKAGGQNTKELEDVVSNLFNEDEQQETSPPGSPSQSMLQSPPQSPPSMSSPQAIPHSGKSDIPGSPMARSSSGPVTPEPVTPPRRTYTSEFDDVAQVKEDKPQKYVKTLRLSSESLKGLNLKPGKNDMKFVVRHNGSTVTANIFLWDSKTPVVISDIDGTITKSDALGHLYTFVGKDWTHSGVSRLFTDISNNGYNIMYLTSRSVGLADGTRGYLHSINQDGFKLPPGPVILSPDRTMAALKREVIMRKPEIFKMACLRDIQKLYDYDYEEGMTPFYAGFGNRITDALSYRSVGVPSTKIFTIDTESEVKLEILEMTGVKSSYISISQLVDLQFPPVLTSQNIKGAGVASEFSDSNFWKQPLVELSDDEDERGETPVPSTSSRGVSGSLDWNKKINATFSESDYSETETESESE